MVGQYPLAPFVGKVLDHYGPRMCSFAAAILFSFGFGLFSLEIANTPDEITGPSTSSFQRLSVYFALASFGTVLSYAHFPACIRRIGTSEFCLKVFLYRILSDESPSPLHGCSVWN